MIAGRATSVPIHTGLDRSRADNHGQRQIGLDLRRSPSFAGDGPVRTGFWGQVIVGQGLNRPVVPGRPIRSLVAEDRSIERRPATRGTEAPRVRTGSVPQRFSTGMGGH
jgi:hypothetical protein